MKKKFTRQIVFSKTPLKTFFHHADFLQIYPCDFPNAPKSGRCDDIPLVIEYWYDEEAKPTVPKEFEGLKIVSEGTTQINRLKRITNILSALTNHRIFSYPSTSTKWGFILPEIEELEKDEVKKEVDNSSSKVIVNMYNYPNDYNDKKIDAFITPKYDMTKAIRHQDYYMEDPVESRDKNITLPDTLNRALYRYLNLDGNAKKVVDTVAHLICNGIDLEREMKSLSFLSFVSSIETLLNFEYRDKNKEIEFECHDCQTIKKSPFRCHKCDRPIWGISSKFKMFLQTYVSRGEEAKKKYNRIYKLRSNIVHSGTLLLGDEELNWEKSEKVNSEWMTHLETKQLARLSLANWLLMGQGKEL